MPARKRLEIDRRVGIALSALSPAQRRAADRVLHSPEVFDVLASNHANIDTIKNDELALFLMRISPSLRLVFQKTHDRNHVLDLVDSATMRQFATKSSKKHPAKSPLRARLDRPKRKKPAAADS